MHKKHIISTHKPLSIIKITAGFLLLLCCGISSLGRAQEGGAYDNSYEAAINQVNECTFYDMAQFDTIYKFVIVDTFHSRIDSAIYWGWIRTRDKNEIDWLLSYGLEARFSKKQMVSCTPFLPDSKGADAFLSQPEDQLAMFNRGQNYLAALWFQKKGNTEVSRRLLKDRKAYPDNELIRLNFGSLYFDAMLKAYTEERNYAKAIYFGSHLSKAAFDRYQYQREIIQLTAQLKKNPEDFVSFRLPGYKEWDSLKQTIDRTTQIKFLVARLRLINCIQPGQPAGISYTMEQYAVPFAQAEQEEWYYWEPSEKYSVLNPYNELKKMNLNTQELKLLLPLMSDDVYIPTYTYFRSFLTGRTVHRLNWVVNELLFDITSKRFTDNSVFDTMTTVQKEGQVEKIRAWCDENKNLNEKAITRDILYGTHNWQEFRKALSSAIKQADSVVLPVLEARFYDFKGDGWPSEKGTLARVMFEKGNAKNNATVRRWNQDTTDQWVALWTSLFLIKYDKDSYAMAMQKLNQVLKDCDGTAYYPHAMDLLLSLPDPKAKQMAEGILEKKQFQDMIYWGYYSSFVKKLLRANSDYTCAFLCEKLRVLKFEEGGPNALYPDDMFVMAAERLRNPQFELQWSSDQKKTYSRELAQWLAQQYELYKTGGQSAINLTVTDEQQPSFFLDAPR